MNTEQGIKNNHFRLIKSKVIRLCSLFLVLCSLTLNAQQQWYFFVDERYPAERNQLQNKRRILIVNNALQQPQAVWSSRPKKPSKNMVIKCLKKNAAKLNRP